MATIHQLCDAGAVVALGGGLDVNEQPLFAIPHVVEWLGQVLPGLDADFHEGRQYPLEQADDLFHDFVSGDDFSYYARSHSMLPRDPGVWELKTPDLRLFGWFAGRGVFIIAEIDTAFRCKKHSLYPGYLGSVVRRRDALNLDEPKFITGDYKDVL